MEPLNALKNSHIEKTPPHTLHALPNRSGGFTLLEILVAITILSITLAALIQTTVTHSRNVTLIKERTYAHWIAKNKFIELDLATTWPATGEKQSKVEWAGREWGILTKVSNTPNHEIRMAEVEVYRTPKREELVAEVRGFLSKPLVAVTTRSTEKEESDDKGEDSP
jgi:general secretion pathway protein I